MTVAVRVTASCARTVEELPIHDVVTGKTVHDVLTGVT
jgi:hypothetical protein